MIIAIVVALLGASVYGKIQQSKLHAMYPAPGQLVDIGGYQLHIDCRGVGRPTIVLEAGQGESSLTWATIQSALAKHTRVCAYDRAGYGWSERSSLSRTVPNMVEELHTLLVRAKIDGPYVLVGHSIGGLAVRLFAQRYPQAVVGLASVAGLAVVADLGADVGDEEWGRGVEIEEEAGGDADQRRARLIAHAPDAAVIAESARQRHLAQPRTVASDAAALRRRLRGGSRAVHSNVDQSLWR